MLTEDDQKFLKKAKELASSRMELTSLLRQYVEENYGDCLVCKNRVFRDLLNEK